MPRSRDTRDRVLDQHSFSKDDGTGAKVRLSLWNHPGDGIYETFARCQKLVGVTEFLYGRRGRWSKVSRFRQEQTRRVTGAAAEKPLAHPRIYCIESRC